MMLLVHFAEVARIEAIESEKHGHLNSHAQAYGVPNNESGQLS